MFRKNHASVVTHTRASSRSRYPDQPPNFCPPKIRRKIRLAEISAEYVQPNMFSRILAGKKFALICQQTVSIKFALCVTTANQHLSDCLTETFKLFTRDVAYIIIHQLVLLHSVFLAVIQLQFFCIQWNGVTAVTCVHKQSVQFYMYTELKYNQKAHIEFEPTPYCWCQSVIARSISSGYKEQANLAKAWEGISAPHRGWAALQNLFIFFLKMVRLCAV